jgi:hypothetical protein
VFALRLHWRVSFAQAIPQPQPHNLNFVPDMHCASATGMSNSFLRVSSGSNSDPLDFYATSNSIAFKVCFILDFV